MLLKNKKILLMMPDFYSLRIEIESELKRQGAIVHYIPTNTHKEDFLLYRTLISFLYFIINPYYRYRYTNNILKKVRGNKYDYLFVVGIYGCTGKLISYLKKHNQIETTFYYWDAFISWNFSRYLYVFDNNFTYDIVDYNKYKAQGMNYLPLFYIEETNNITYSDKKYDIVSIGTLNSKYVDRLSIVNYISENTSNRYNTFFLLFVSELNSSFFLSRNIKNKIKCWLRYFVDPKYRSFIKCLQTDGQKNIHNEKISASECKIIESSSKSILDINIENAGCSYRIINALARKIKVITTNKNIINETFYSPNNICVIDKNNPIIDENFLNSEFEDVDMTYLRIDNWIKAIFSSK